ncbi:MAG: ATP-binding cassette domain-containing protein [Ignavibacteriaceae bacterium]|nr:ATP-binding cassette domain-containing protein [Ignavibacteriaceae bacterium]
MGSKSKWNISAAKNGNEFLNIEGFEYHKNKINFLFGESGIGKSLISKIIYGAAAEYGLEIKVNGVTYEKYLESDINKKIRKNGFFVFQEPSTHLNPLEKISTQLTEGDLTSLRNETEIFNEISPGVSKTETESILSVYPKTFRPSGGEKQRILLTMALKKIKIYQSGSEDAETLFVFDEPTGSLDNKMRNAFIDYLLITHSYKNFSAIFITHDYSIISYIENRHKNLVQNILYSELYKAKTLEFRKFDPAKYLNWIKERKNISKSKKVGNGDVVLQFDQGVEIFGKRLEFINFDGKKDERGLVIRAGDAVYLKAPSGTGKTTIAKIIMGIYSPEKASFTIAGLKSPKVNKHSFYKNKIWGRKAAMVFQNADESLNLNSKVKNIFDGLPIDKRDSEEFLKKNLSNFFDVTIINDFSEKKISKLSGGQKQRLNIIRTMVLSTPLIILDEPFNGLDFESIDKVIKMIDTLLSMKCGILLISHNEEIVETLVLPSNIYHLNSCSCQ